MPHCVRHDKEETVQHDMEGCHPQAERGALRDVLNQARGWIAIPSLLKGYKHPPIRNPSNAKTE